MKVMGVDPGLANTGVALVSGKPGRVAAFAYKTIRTSPKEPSSRRLWALFSAVSRILSEDRPDLVVIEAVFSSPRHPKSGIYLGLASGAILAACGSRNVSAVEVAPREVKQTLTGSGSASKEQIERALCGLLNHPGPIRPSHASDALAMAILGLYRADVILAGKGPSTPSKAHL